MRKFGSGNSRQGFKSKKLVTCKKNNKMHRATTYDEKGMINCWQHQGQEERVCIIKMLLSKFQVLIHLCRCLLCKAYKNVQTSL